MCLSEEKTFVLYVRRQDAKAVKTRLESVSFLDKRFRMSPVVAGDGDSIFTGDATNGTDSRSGTDISKADVANCIAVPVTAECIERLQQYHSDGPSAGSRSSSASSDDKIILSNLVVAFGRQICPFSSSMLGNNTTKSRRRTTATSRTIPLTNVQYALMETLTTWQDININERTNDETNRAKTIETFVRGLSIQTCPKKLEVIGDDRTLVVPSCSLFVSSILCRNSSEGTKVFDVSSKKNSTEFREFLVSMIHGHMEENENGRGLNNCNDEDTAIIYEIQSQLWKNLANIHNSPRVVRRGDIHPESGVRESGHRILFPIMPLFAHDKDSINNGDYNRGFLPTHTGPTSPGWITVTEHKIHQSFDLTRVMFSRGNVTEKNRFGMLCKPGENVLDMYAGIGYYTLPALIHGRVGHVTACEWNGHALAALKYNLKANGVENKATVLEGDCRVQLKQLLQQSSRNKESEMKDDTNLITKEKQFDRISLGLLPSSEGGWAIAVSCLHQSTGGWLHVHANVPTVERQEWAHWMCRSLANIAADQADSETTSKDWIAVCTHVEKVKSFAPKVDHVVADVFVGPCDSPKMPILNDSAKPCSETGLVDSSGKFNPTPLDCSPASCALNEEGILSQKWMREIG